MRRKKLEFSPTVLEDEYPNGNDAGSCEGSVADGAKGVKERSHDMPGSRQQTESQTEAFVKDLLLRNTMESQRTTLQDHVPYGSRTSH